MESLWISFIELGLMETSSQIRIKVFEIKLINGLKQAENLGFIYLGFHFDQIVASG